MHQAVVHACGLVQGLNKEDFFTGKQTQKAIIMNLMNLITIGEAAPEVVDGYGEFAQAHPEVPWRSMRSRLDDCYVEINLDLVWETLQTALPALLKQLPAVREDADAKIARTSGRSSDVAAKAPGIAGHGADPMAGRS